MVKLPSHSTLSIPFLDQTDSHCYPLFVTSCYSNIAEYFWPFSDFPALQSTSRTNSYRRGWWNSVVFFCWQLKWQFRVCPSSLAWNFGRFLENMKLSAMQPDLIIMNSVWKPGTHQQKDDNWWLIHRSFMFCLVPKFGSLQMIPKPSTGWPLARVWM